MTAWSRTRTMSWPARALIGLGLLAVLLIAAVPAALVAGLILMLLGHVIGGLALFGASILAAGGSVAAVTTGGLRQLRKLVRQQLNQQTSQYASPMVQLSRDAYRYD